MICWVSDFLSETGVLLTSFFFLSRQFCETYKEFTTILFLGWALHVWRCWTCAETFMCRVYHNESWVCRKNWTPGQPQGIRIRTIKQNLKKNKKVAIVYWSLRSSKCVADEGVWIVSYVKRIPGFCCNWGENWRIDRLRMFPCVVVRLNYVIRIFQRNLLSVLGWKWSHCTFCSGKFLR